MRSESKRNSFSSFPTGTPISERASAAPVLTSAHYFAIFACRHLIFNAYIEIARTSGFKDTKNTSKLTLSL